MLSKAKENDMVGFIIRIKMKFSQKKVGDNIRQSTIKLQVWPFKDRCSQALKYFLSIIVGFILVVNHLM